MREQVRQLQCTGELAGDACSVPCRCHRDRSGFDGPWSFSPTTFSSEYFRLLMEEKW